MARNSKDSPQQRGARTRAKNKRKNGVQKFVQGFGAGYLLGAFDAQRGITRTPKQIARIAAAGLQVGLY